MSTQVTVIFDGEVFRPEVPVELPVNQRYLITIEETLAQENSIFVEPDSIDINPNSAEGKALHRIANVDFDDASQWIADGEIGEEIDVKTINQRLKERGYQIQVSFTDS
jgi:hypothetical protein